MGTHGKNIMANLFRIFFLIFVFAGVAVHDAVALRREYVSMILDVHKHFKTSSVCFIMPRKHWNLYELTFAHVLSREFSRMGALSLIINDEATKDRTNKCRNTVDRPLIVVLLRTFEDVNDFSEDVRGTSIAHPIWLLIFTNESNSSICGYCRKPGENIFGLRFDAQMLISCCGESLLREWWTIHGNETRTVAYGEWTNSDGLTLKTNKSLYARRSQVDGMAIRVAYVSNSAFRIISNGKIGGFLNALLMELKRVMNFEITAIVEAAGFGSWNQPTQTWSGAVELINSGKIDLGVAEFSMTSHRLDVVDYTLPFMMSELKLYIKARDSSGVQWSAHFKAFAYQIWVTIIFLVIASTILVAAMNRRTGLSSSFPYLISEHYLYIWGIFCQQGLAVFPVETSLRIAYSSIFVSALVVSAAYSASLISFITVSTATLPFSSLQEFADDGSYRLIVLQNSADWNMFDSSLDPIVVKMKKLMKPWNELPQSMTDGFKQICTEKVAFFSSEAMAKTSHKYFPCKVGQIKTGTIDSLAMIMPAGNPFTGLVNYHIQRFEDNGMINRWKYIYLRNPTEPEVKHNEVTLWGVAPILSVLAGGIILSLVFLSCEKLYKPRARQERNTWRTFHSSGFHSQRIRNQEFSRNEHRKQPTTYLP